MATVPSWEYYETIMVCMGNSVQVLPSEAIKNAVDELGAHDNPEVAFKYACHAIGVVLSGGKKRE